MSTNHCNVCKSCFLADPFTQNKQICATCITNKTSKDISIGTKRKISTVKLPCQYCHASIKIKDGGNVSCNHCLKNYKTYGKPNKCRFCRLNSAFIGTKCQRCYNAKKVFGEPLKCDKCELKSAFDNHKARINGHLLCWVCCMDYHKKGKKRRLNDVQEEVIFEETVLFEDTEAPLELDTKYTEKPERELTLDDRINMIRDAFPTKNETPPATDLNCGGNQNQIKQQVPNFQESLPFEPFTNNWMKFNGMNNNQPKIPLKNDGNIFEVTKLQEEKETLKKQMIKLQQQLVEKDKMISLMKAEIIQTTRLSRDKEKNLKEMHDRKVEGLNLQIQDLVKKNCQKLKARRSMKDLLI